MAAAPTMTPADLATVLGTDARTARKFLRTITPRDEQPGKGSRWSIKGTKTELTRLGKEFTKFTAAQAEAKAKREEAKNDAPEVEVIEEAREVLAESGNDEPTDEELREAEMLLDDLDI